MAAVLRETATPAALGHFILRGDLQYRRIAEAARRGLIAGAIADGARQAELVRTRWGSDAGHIARMLHLRVEVTRDEEGGGTTVLFGEYRSRSRTVRLYRPAIERLNAALADAVWQDWLGIADAMPVFLAHEIYHHLDTTESGVPVARRTPVCLLQIGTWRWTSGIQALSEIAAGSFAQTLLGLPVHAKLLDFVMLHAADAELAARAAASLAEP